MSTLKLHNIEPATGTDVALGAAGDSITVSGDSLKTNTIKDAGGNALFTSNGAGVLSGINSGLTPGGHKLILNQACSGSSSVEFTTGIDSTYDKYLFVMVNLDISNEQEIRIAFYTNDWTPTVTSAFWESRHEAGDATGWAYHTSYDEQQAAMPSNITRNHGNNADCGVNGFVELYNPEETTYVTQYSIETFYEDTSAGANHTYVTGYVNSAHALTGCRFTIADGSAFTGGNIKMYGIV